PGLGELGLVLLENALRLGLRGLGPLDTALDRLAPLLQNLVDVRKELLAQDEEDDREGNQADDQLGHLGDERTLRLFRGRQLYQGRDHISSFRRSFSSARTGITSAPGRRSP